MILVTGGTGLIGAHLLLKLVKTEAKVRAIYRNADKIETTKRIFSYYENSPETLLNKIEWIEADLNNIPQLENAFKGVTHVYHCAALISFDPNDYYKLRKINIEGTANIVNLCLANNIKKLCYVSTIAALGKTLNNTPITENTDWNPEAKNHVYGITKYGAEMEVWRGSQEGLDVVIVNPGMVLGPGTWNTGSGSLFKRVYKGLPRYTVGVTGYVYVNDVVDIMMQLMASTIKNERFIAVAKNLSFKDFTEKTATVLNVKPPQKPVKQWMLEIAWRLDWLRNLVFKTPRVLTKLNARTLNNSSIYSNEKVKNAINFKFTDIDTTIKKVSQLYLNDLKQ